MKTSKEIDQLCHRIIGACIEVHKALGPGLLENIYQRCLCRELSLNGINYQEEYSISLEYKGLKLDSSLRADLLIEDTVILELKAVNEWNAIFEAQLISYLKLADKPVGLLVNFNVPVLKDGVKRLFNGIQ